jgi:mannosyl-glycoprotein endo-beta-N-acetylglucosaminidase
MANSPIPGAGAPTIQALTSFSQLLGWTTPTDPTSLASVARVPLAGRPKLNGLSSMVGFDNVDWQYDQYFTELSQGGTGNSTTRTAANVYNFSFWQYLDISYYFGHQLVTIPPTVWTNAAHANGVVSLGTFNVNGFNVSQYNVQQVANQLIKIAQFYQFEGYLFNDENQGNPSADPNWDLQLMNMLQMNTMKPLMVFWYDSPVSSGTGGYANELTNSAIPFFKAAGYFQANYWWGNAYPGPSPQNSFNVLKANFPGYYLDLRNRVFSALYAYGPPIYGGGFFESYGMINSQSQGYLTGLGVYAPAYTMYWCLQTNDQQLPDRMTFQNNDQAFWAGTTDYLGYVPTCGSPPTNVTPNANQCIGYYVTPRTAIIATPFVTDFNTGEGNIFNLEGIMAAKTPWNNLSIQSLLPSWRYEQSGTASFDIVFGYDRAFNGGSSLTFSQPKMGPGQSGLVKLYATALTLTATIQVYLTVQNAPGTYLPDVRLALFLDGKPSPQLLAASSQTVANGWTTLRYLVPVSYAGRALNALGVQLGNSAGTSQPVNLALGQLRLVDSTQTPPKPTVQTFAPAAVLSWKINYNPTSAYRVYGVAGSSRYLLGIVRNYVFSVAGSILNTNQTGFTSFIVQEVNKFGGFTPV